MQNNLCASRIHKLLFTIVISICIMGIYTVLSPFLINMYIWNAFRLFSWTQMYIGNLLRILVITVFGVLCIVQKKSINWKAIVIPLFLFLVFWFIDLEKHVETGRLRTVFYHTLIMILLLQIVCSWDYLPKITFRSLTILYTILALLSTVFKFWPELYYRIGHWEIEAFLGGDNISNVPLMFGLVYALLDAKYSNTKQLLIFYIICYAAALYSIWCATALVGALLFCLFLIPFIRKIIEKTPLFVFILFSLILFSILMWFVEDFLNFPLISYFIQNILHKSLTLTDRLDIWEWYLQQFYQKPFTGYGFADTVGFYLRDGITYFAHNLYLHTLYEGGIISLAYGLVSLTIAGWNVEKRCGRQIAGILKLAIFSILIMSQSDFSVYWSWYPLLILESMMLSLPIPNIKISSYRFF